MRACAVAQSCQLSATTDSSAQAPLPIGLSWPELEWVAIFSSRHLPDPEIKPASFTSPALVDRLFTTEPPGKPRYTHRYHIIGSGKYEIYIYPFWLQVSSIYTTTNVI